LLYNPAMSGTRQHYERAFEAWLRREGLPHVLVDDARRAILPPGATPALLDAVGGTHRLKSFDFVVYGADRHALVEVKGRRVDLRRGGSGRRESWTTTDDIRSLTAWEGLFGEPFGAVLVFMYWLDGPAASAGEPRVFRFEGRVYAHRAVRLSDYTREMKPRSPKWGTVDLPTEAFERVAMSIGRVLTPPDPVLFEPKPGPGGGQGSVSGAGGPGVERAGALA